MPPKCSNNLRTGQQCQNYAAHPKPFCNGCIREYGPNGNVAPVQQPQPSHSAVQPALCKAKDCDLYGSRDGYCSKHYNQQLSEIKSPKPVQVPPPAQVSQSVPVLDSKSALHRLQEILSRSRINSAIQGRLQKFLNALSEILALARDQEHSREKELECSIHEIISCLDEKDSKSSKISELRGAGTSGGCVLHLTSFASGQNLAILATCFTHHVKISAGLILQLNRALRKILHFSALTMICQNAVPALLGVAEVSCSTEVIIVLEDLLLGYTHNPDLFFTHLPSLLRFLSEIDSSDPKSAQRLVCLIRALLLTFSSYVATQTFEEPIFDKYPPVAFKSLEDLLAAHKWRSPGPELDSWPEGKWSDEDKTNTLALAILNGCTGWRVSGTLTRLMPRVSCELGRRVLVCWDRERALYITAFVKQSRPYELLIVGESDEKKTRWVPTDSLIEFRSLNHLSSVRTHLVAARIPRENDGYFHRGMLVNWNDMTPADSATVQLCVRMLSVKLV